MEKELQAKSADEFGMYLAEAGRARTATFVFVNDTDYDAVNLNHGWEFRSGGGLITLGATCYKNERYSKATVYESGCMVRVVFNFRLGGRYFEKRSGDAPSGKCYGRYTYRIYSSKSFDGVEEIKDEIIWESVFDE